jgi:hypothetical protein
MAFTSEGTIEIDLADFWEWVHKEHLPAPQWAEIEYGVPRVNKSNMTLDIDFAASSERSPADWIQKPKAVTQWNELECASTDVAQTEPLDISLNPAEDGAQKIIELRVSQTFYDAVKLLAETEGIARADVIRKAVSRYVNGA